MTTYTLTDHQVLPDGRLVVIRNGQTECTNPDGLLRGTPSYAPCPKPRDAYCLADLPCRDRNPIGPPVEFEALMKKCETCHGDGYVGFGPWCLRPTCPDCIDGRPLIDVEGLGRFTVEVLPVVDDDEADRQDAAYYGPACAITWPRRNGITIQPAWDGSLEADDCTDVRDIDAEPGQWVAVFTPEPTS